MFVRHCYRVQFATEGSGGEEQIRIFDWPKRERNREEKWRDRAEKKKKDEGGREDKVRDKNARERTEQSRRLNETVRILTCNDTGGTRKRKFEQRSLYSR
jgi:hypothetical protein